LQSIILKYDCSPKAAEKLYQHMWIYCHGIATLSATKTCFFSSEEISEMVTQVFLSLLEKVKSDD
ncbi:TetR/AcrR family transcriptional regulator, partial [Enterococcus faecalis]|nr:TetR/AcrR family transcriptional regulator [Enterococcus faecalis]